MCAKIAWILTPKAIEAILLRMIHKPIAGLMSDALTRNDIAKGHVRKARWHNSGINGERLTDVASDAVCQIRKVAFSVNAGIDVHARSVGQRGL